MNRADGGIRPLVTAATVLGLGMGGFVDGILFHQVLQLHGMLSARVDRVTVTGIEINMFWDGLFHVATWTLVALGLGLLWGAVRRPGAILDTRVFAGSLCLGWGIFNLVEGLVDHHLLGIHHVVEVGHVTGWDFLFLGSGVVLTVLGWSAIRRGARLAAPPGPHTSIPRS